MSKSILNNAVQVSRHLINSIVKKDFIAIDATLGNGNDILYLSNIVGEKGFVYGFDVQESAILNTEILLKEKALYQNYKLINDSHEKISSYVKEKVDFIIFNLGYLPGGDKNIVTKSESTISAIKDGISVLKKQGTLFVIVYPGHESGEKELHDIIKFANTLNQKEVDVMKVDFINQRGKPPVLITFERKID